MKVVPFFHTSKRTFKGDLTTLAIYANQLSRLSTAVPPQRRLRAVVPFRYRSAATIYRIALTR